MYEQVEKTKKNKSRAVANSVAQKKSDVKQGFGFVDNRAQVNIKHNPKQLKTSDKDSETQNEKLQIHMINTKPLQLGRNKKKKMELKEKAKEMGVPCKKKGSKKKKQKQKHDRQYEDDITKFVNKSEDSKVSKGHAKKRHVNISDCDLVARNISLSSSFESFDDLNNALQIIFKTKYEEISSWFLSENERLPLTINRPETIKVKAFSKMKGIGPSFRPTDSDELPYIVAIFDRNEALEKNPYGLVTCFPSAKKAQ